MTCYVCGSGSWVVAGLCWACRRILMLSEKDVQAVCDRIETERMEARMSDEETA